MWKRFTSMPGERIAAYLTGAGLIALGILRPGAAPALMTPGVGLVMWATKFPERKHAEKEEGEDARR